MPDDDVPRDALAIIEIVAGAVRDELGEEIDAYPGFASPERADPINRAFRAVVRSLLEWASAAADSLPVLVSRTLRLAAERRLAADGFDPVQARSLIEAEPLGRDDWLAFLVLSSVKQIRDAIADRESPD
jgi:hypothetical protein